MYGFTRWLNPLDSISYGFKVRHASVVYNEQNEQARQICKEQKYRLRAVGTLRCLPFSTVPSRPMHTSPALTHCLDPWIDAPLLAYNPNEVP